VKILEGTYDLLDVVSSFKFTQEWSSPDQIS